jgi:germination protein M
MAAKKKARHNQETILFILMGLIVVGLIVSGYFLFVGKILPELSGTNQPKKITVASSTESSTPKTTSIDLLPPSETQTIRIYFQVKGKDSLKSEFRKVRKQKMLLAQAKTIMETLLSGPKESGLHNTIPEGTTLRSVFFDKGTFIIDLSKEFKLNLAGGAMDELLSVYSIVNSVTELDPNSKVKILINGNEIATAGGHSDLSQKLTRNEKLISQ